MCVCEWRPSRRALCASTVLVEKPGLQWKLWLGGRLKRKGKEREMFRCIKRKWKCLGHGEWEQRRKEEENKCWDDRKSRRGREMGGFGPPLWVLVSPVSSTGPQQTTESKVDGKETQEVVGEKFLELSGRLSDTCLWLTNLPLLSPSLSSRGELSLGRESGC